MHALLNKYSQGYVAVPIINACQRLGIFAILQDHSWITTEELAARSGTQIGYLRIVLHFLRCISWIDHRQNERGQETVCLTAAAVLNSIPAGLSNLYHAAPAAMIENEEYQVLQTHWLAHLLLASNQISAVDLVDGSVLAPLLYLLHQHSHEKETGSDPFWRLPKQLRNAVTDYFIMRGWAVSITANSNNVNVTQLCLTEIGHELIKQAPAMGVALSYRPLLAQLDTLLKRTITAESVSNQIGYEKYLDRNLYLEASTFQKQLHFNDVAQLITKIFDNADFGDQPHYIIDMDCGDGRYLQQLLEEIRTNSRRGQELHLWPLTLIGVAPNELTLQAAEQTLKDLPHRLFLGDITDPQRLLRDLQANNIAADQVLHVHSNLDHDFAIDHFIDRDLHFSAEAPKDFALRPSSVYIDAAGAPLAPYDVVRHWRANLERWATLLGGHGLIVAEAHCLNADLTKLSLDQGENLSFDHLCALSCQYLIDAELFFVLAANVGLFADSAPQRYPRKASYCGATLSHLRLRNYCVRHAHLTDLCALTRIEERCWPRALRTPVAELSRRISEYPQGQFVLEWHGQVSGVIYSQRIASIDSVAGLSADTIQQAHRSDGALVQLLALSVLPSLKTLQSRQIGDDLLEFMLQLCSVMNGVEDVVAIPLCSTFRREEELPVYLERSARVGDFSDPILTFSQRHGGRIKVVIPEHHPSEEITTGDCIRTPYDLLNRNKEHSADYQSSQ